jgi:hypothetical protein
MEYEDFVRRAAQMWEEIPAQLKQGVSGVWVEREAEWDPEFPDVPLMGLCVPEESLWGVQLAEVTSKVLVFHGSFVEVAARDPGFDWEWELRETLTHELEHHLDWRSGRDDLGLEDDGQRENMRRRAGEAFVPGFHRVGQDLGGGAWAFDGDGFIEVRVSRWRWRGGLRVVRWGGWAFEVDVPARALGAWSYVECEGWEPEEEGASEEPEWWDQAVVVFRRSWWVF